MLLVLLTLVTVAVIVCGAEFLWRHKKHHSEVTRKLVHISVASFAAVWPWYLSWRQIFIVSLLLLAGITISKFFKLFKGIHSIDRVSWGEILFAIAIAMTALLAESRFIYAAALLHLGIADGMAAVIGVKYGKLTRYKVFGHTKSIVGTAMCFACSAVILTAYVGLTKNSDVWSVAILLACLVTLLENVAIRGIDNIAVPLCVVLLLNSTL
jgi:phytol kinase